MHSQLRSCRKHSKSLADTKYWEILENPKSFPPQYLCLSVSFSTVRILIGNQHSAFSQYLTDSFWQMYLLIRRAFIFWECGRTDRLHFSQLVLVFYDGGAEFLLLCFQLQLQFPVLLLLLVHLGVSALVASPHLLPPVHHLSQFVHSLREKKINHVIYTFTEIYLW